MFWGQIEEFKSFKKKKATPPTSKVTGVEPSNSIIVTKFQGKEKENSWIRFIGSANYKAGQNFNIKQFLNRHLTVLINMILLLLLLLLLGKKIK